MVDHAFNHKMTKIVRIRLTGSNLMFKKDEFTPCNSSQFLYILFKIIDNLMLVLLPLLKCENQSIRTSPCSTLEEYESV